MARKASSKKAGSTATIGFEADFGLHTAPELGTFRHVRHPELATS